MGLFGAAQGWWGECPPQICHTYPTMQWWNLAQVPLPKEDSKNVWITWHTPCIMLTSLFFLRISANFVISRNKDIDYILIHNNIIASFESLKIVFINTIPILMMSAKKATLGFLKLRVFWSKDYNVTISVHAVTNQILSRDSNYTIDVVMWLFWSLVTLAFLWQKLS